MSLSRGQRQVTILAKGILEIRDIVQEAIDTSQSSWYLEAGWMPDDFTRASCLLNDMVRLSRMEPMRGPEQCLIASSPGEKTSPH